MLVYFWTASGLLRDWLWIIVENAERKQTVLWEMFGVKNLPAIGWSIL